MALYQLGNGTLRQDGGPYAARNRGSLLGSGARGPSVSDGCFAAAGFGPPKGKKLGGGGMTPPPHPPSTQPCPFLNDSENSAYALNKPRPLEIMLFFKNRGFEYI